MVTAVDQHQVMPLETLRLEHLVANQPSYREGAQTFGDGNRDASEVVVDGLVDGEVVLAGAGQAVEVGEHGRALAHIEVELAAGAKFEEEEAKGVVKEETLVVGDALLAACVGEVVEPGGEVGEEVTEGLDEDGTGLQVLPPLRFWL